VSGYLYASLSELADYNAGTVSWDRAITALRAARPTDPQFARSIGATVTYWVTRPVDMVRPELTAHRRYRTLLRPLGGSVDVVVAPIDRLTAVSEYDDQNDVELFTGPGRALRLQAGSVLLVDLDEAWAVVRPADGDAGAAGALAVVRLTPDAEPARPRQPSGDAALPWGGDVAVAS
jgi:evolved beta-galactosidase subunit beta